MKENLQKQIIESMKARDSERLSALKMLMAEIKNAEIDARGELSDEQFISVVKKEVKKRRDSIESYEKAAREDLVSKEKAELAVLSEFMPEQMSENEVHRIIDEVISELEAKDASQMGAIMNKVMEKTKGNADGKLIATLVRSKLQS